MRTAGFRLLQLAIGVAVFAYVVSLVRPSHLREAVSGDGLGWLALGACLNLAMALLFGVRSTFVLSKLGHRIDARTAMPIAIVGNVAGALTPASSGEIVRGALLRSRAQVPVADAVSLVLFERGLSVYLIVLVTGVCAVMLAAPAALFPLVAAGAAPLVFLPGAVLLVASRLIGRHPRASSGAIVRRIRESVEAVAGLATDPLLVVRWGTLTVLMVVIAGAQYWMIARSLGDGIDFNEAIISLGASQLAGIVTLLPLGLGSADATLVSLWDRFGLASEQGASGAVLVRVVVTLPLILVAVASYVFLTRQARAATAGAAEDGEAAAMRAAPR